MPRSSQQRKEARIKGERAAREANPWQDAFRTALEQDDVQTAFSVLDSQKTGHAGTPRQAEKLPGRQTHQLPLQ